MQDIFIARICAVPQLVGNSVGFLRPFVSPKAAVSMLAFAGLPFPAAVTNFYFVPEALGYLVVHQPVYEVGRETERSSAAVSPS